MALGGYRRASSLRPRVRPSALHGTACPVDGALKTRNHFVCARCWYLVPLDLRRQFMAAARAKDRDQLLAAKREILDCLQNKQIT